MSINFKGKTAIVTGAGGGLGREHALSFARLGANVVVNDLGSSREGTGGSSDAANAVVAEIKEMGGQAIADGANVTNFAQVEAMVQAAMDAFGRVDILVNNAGILRDKTMSKGTLEDFQTVVDVHLMGSVNCTKAVWEIMRTQNYGRIIMTGSSSGLYGNFGQSNYGSAKMGVIGLMNSLELEGAKYNVHVNTLAPVAATRMTEELLPENMHELLSPAVVSPAVLFMASEGAPNGEIISAGAGCFSRIQIVESDAALLGANASPDDVAAAWNEKLTAMPNARAMTTSMEQSQRFIQQLMAKNPEAFK